MKNKDFAVFILTHGRPDKVITVESLRKCGYTGQVYIVVDDMDKTLDQYKAIYGEKVLVFDKKRIAEKVDNGDNFNDLRTTTHARNAIFEFAKKLGITYFIQLDDDYTAFCFSSDDNYEYTRKEIRIQNLDKIMDIMIDFYKSIPSCLSVAMAQGGDFIGGADSSVFKKGLARKCMNSFLCSTERPFQFISRLNEDVNTYISIGARGGLFFTIANIRLEQLQTQANSGGMSETYIENGTYIKSFYSVMYAPSFVDVRVMGVSNKRLHHCINWKKAVPVIIREEHRKASH